MKSYLFGLGAMLVGAGLMFVLMHGEVSADSKGGFHCEYLETEFMQHDKCSSNAFIYCKVKDLTCVTEYGEVIPLGATKF